MNTEKGFSLIQVIIAAGLMAVLALNFAKLSQNQIKAQKAVEVRSENQWLEQKVRALMSDGQYCNATLAGQDLAIEPSDAESLNSLRNPNGEPIYAVNQIFNNQVQIESISYQFISGINSSFDIDPNGDTSVTPPVPPNNHIALIEFTIQWQRLGRMLASSSNRTSFQMEVELENQSAPIYDATISECRGLINNDFMAFCLNLEGYEWTGGTCVQNGNFNDYIINLCNQLGGTWGASGCNLNNPLKAPNGILLE